MMSVIYIKLAVGAALCVALLVIWLLFTWGKAPRILPRHTFARDVAVFAGTAIVSIVGWDLFLYGRGVWTAVLTQAAPAMLVALTLSTINCWRRYRFNTAK